MNVAETSLAIVAGVPGKPATIRRAVRPITATAAASSRPPSCPSGKSSRTAAVASGSDTAASTSTCTHVPASGPYGASTSTRASPPSGAPSRRGSKPALIAPGTDGTASVRRQVLVPLAEHPERAPEGLLGCGFVETRIDVRGRQELDRGGEPLECTLRVAGRLGQGEG